MFIIINNNLISLFNKMTTINDFELYDKLGEGSFSSVYKGILIILK